MRLSYEFKNQYGSLYTSANVVYVSDTSILSVSGNRVLKLDLSKHTTSTLPFSSRSDISYITYSPQSSLLLVIDVTGRALLVNLKAGGVVLRRLNFKSVDVKTAKFSPNGSLLLVGVSSRIHLYQITSPLRPLDLVRVYSGHYAPITSLSWTPCSRFFASGSEDSTVRIYSSAPILHFRPITLSSHKSPIVNLTFHEKNLETLYTVSRDGSFFVWNWVQAPTLSTSSLVSSTKKRFHLQLHTKGQFVLSEKHYLQLDHSTISTCAFSSNLLAVGFDSGVFSLYTLSTSECQRIHHLSVSSNSITSIALNQNGSWLALGSATLGQLLVWEWESETYVIKQQGHISDVTALTYNSDSSTLVTGGTSGKIKLWQTRTGFCYATFTQHTASINAIQYIASSNAIVSASSDGTVRAYDLFRYRNFRTMTTPSPCRLISLAVDSGGEVVAAGSFDPPEIYLWSLRTGKLVDVLSGHEAPVSTLQFSPTEPLLASGSWDHTVRLWEPYKNTASLESYDCTKEVLALSFHPNGEQLCVSTLSGSLSFWNIKTGSQQSAISGQKDIAGGRLSTSAQSAISSSSGKSFTSVTYSADGRCVLAGGRSKYVCLYEVSQGLLLRKWQLSHNRSLDGITDKIRSDEFEDILQQRRQEIRARSVRFSPTNRSFAVATSTGACIFSLHENSTRFFEPVGLDMDVTPRSVKECSKQGQHVKALRLALRLRLSDIMKLAYEHVPYEQISLVCKEIPPGTLVDLLPFLSRQVSEGTRLEFALRWIALALQHHGTYIRDNMFAMLPHLRNLQRAVSSVQSDLVRLCSKNRYVLEFLCGTHSDHDDDFQNHDELINNKRKREEDDDIDEEEKQGVAKEEEEWGGEWEG